MHIGKIIKVNRLQRSGDINSVSSGDTVRNCLSSVVVHVACICK